MGTLPQWISARKCEVDRIAELIGEVLSEFEHDSFAEAEERALTLANEVTRLFLQKRLQDMADELGDHVVINDQLHRRHQPGVVKYHSLVGPLQVRRDTYRKVGQRNGPTLVALDLDAGLMERATPALAYGIARGYAEGTSRESVKRLQAAHRKPPSRSTVERIATRLGRRFHQRILTAEPRLRRAEKLPDGARAIVVGLDRTSVPMEEEVAPDVRKQRRFPRTRRPGQAVQVRYRMAYVGTVCITDSDADAIVTRRYAAAAHEGPSRLVHRMIADVRRALRQNPNLPVQVVQDNAPEMWNLMRDALGAESSVTQWHETLDRYHVEVRLAAVAEILVRNEAKRRELLSRWRQSLNRNDRAIERILRWINRRVPDWTARHSRAVSPHESYLRDRIGGKRLHYASLHKRGMMMGSGVTEGACKSLIAQRVKRSGQRWRGHGIENVLALRSALHSDRLDRAWRHMQRDYEASVRCAA